MNNNGGFDEKDEDDEGKLKEGWKNSLTQTLRNGMEMIGDQEFHPKSPKNRRNEQKMRNDEKWAKWHI